MVKESRRHQHGFAVAPAFLFAVALRLPFLVVIREGDLLLHFYFSAFSFSAFSAFSFVTSRLFTTLKTPGTPFARIFATSLSACESTPPESVTFPFTTAMRLAFAGSIAFLFSCGYP